MRIGREADGKKRKSKYRGVIYRPSINKRNPWVAKVMVAGKTYSSYHATEEEAGERAQSIRGNKMPFSEV